MNTFKFNYLFNEFCLMKLYKWLLLYCKTKNEKKLFFKIEEISTIYCNTYNLIR